MTQVVSMIHGIYPRSTELVQISRDVDRKRKNVSELKKRVRRDFDELLQLQERSRMVYWEDGKLSWQDIFRPIVEATDGMEVGALTRWFDNNNFYRQPMITDELRLDEKKVLTFFPVLSPKQQWKVTLPSPFLFAKLAHNAKSSSFEKRLSEITDLLTSLVALLSRKGVGFIQLNEPYIPYHGATKEEMALFLKALKRLRKAKGKATLAVHSYFGDARQLVESLAQEEAVDVIGVDFYKTSLPTLPRHISCDIIAGIIDGRNSLIEDKKALRAFVEKAVSHFQLPSTLYLSNNSDLELLPEAVAKKKIKLLGEIPS